MPQTARQSSHTLFVRPLGLVYGLFSIQRFDVCWLPDLDKQRTFQHLEPEVFSLLERGRPSGI